MGISYLLLSLTIKFLSNISASTCRCNITSWNGCSIRRIAFDLTMQLVCDDGSNISTRINSLLWTTIKYQKIRKRCWKRFALTLALKAKHCSIRYRMMSSSLERMLRLVQQKISRYVLLSERKWRHIFVHMQRISMPFLASLDTKTFNYLSISIVDEVFLTKEDNTIN